MHAATMQAAVQESSITCAFSEVQAKAFSVDIQRLSDGLQLAFPE